MNNNERYSINMYQDNNIHIKVNRNSIPYNNKINTMFSNNKLQLNDPNYCGIDKKVNKCKKEELLLKKMNKNKNKLQYLSNTNNLSSLINKQKLNKLNNSEKILFQKYRSEKGIIETLNKIRNNHRKLNNSNKINKSNSNYPYSNTNNIGNNKNSINDYRTKINNNKNRLKNTLFKASSFNNDFKNSIKNLSLKNYNINHNKNNNILIDDITSNDTDHLTESANLNRETNLYVYRSEVQYPVKNLISNLSIQNNNYNDIFNVKYNNSTIKTLNNINDDNKNKSKINSHLRLIESVSKSVGNSRTKRQIYKNGESENNYFSPLQYRIFSNKRSNIKTINNQNIINSSNNSIKINNKYQNLQERLSPILSNYKNKNYNLDTIENDNKLIDRANNNNAKSCHHFYRKKYFSKEKYENAKYYKDFFDEESQNKDNTLYIKSNVNNTNNIFLNEDDKNINNYKYYYINRNKLRNQLKFISIFCDSVEKFLIFILKYYFEYFISQINKYIDSKKINNYKKYYNSENKIKNKNIYNLLSRRIKNKNNPKKLYYLEKDRILINLTNYKKYDNDNKIYSFKIISRNENSNNVYKKKSNSINKSLNQLINKNSDEMIYNRIKKKKNLSFHKVYIPKHKNSQYNKYKTLKINTNSFINEIDLNLNKDLVDNTLNNVHNTMNNIYTQNSIINREAYQTINSNDNIMSKINYITALKRKYINNKNINNSMRISTSNINGINPYNKKIQLTSNNVYTKPLFKKIRNKIIEKKENSIQKKIGVENDKTNGLLINNNSNPSVCERNKNKENILMNSDNKNENNKVNNNLLCKKIVSRKKANSTINNNILKNKLIDNQRKDIIKVNNMKDLNNLQKEEKNYDNEIIRDNLHNKETEIEDTNCNIIRSIIVKDVSSKDRLLNVYIKYYEYKFNSKNNQFNGTLAIISNESITFLNSIKNKNLKSNKNNNYLHQILSSIIEEDEKSKANPSLENSVISEEDSEKKDTSNNNINNNNNLTKNKIIYLKNILQNLFDDNKKTILYIFMRNLKKIHNQIYLKNSLIQYNSIIKNQSRDNSNNDRDTNNNNENQILTCNGGNEVELNNNIVEENNTNNNNIFFYTADNSLFEVRLNNKKNVLIGSLLFKDFEIKDEEYDIIKHKKYFSSSSINKIKTNNSEKNNSNKNKLKNILIEIENKNIYNYFDIWKEKIKNNNNHEINCSIDNGMNENERNNEKNKLREKVEVNNNNFKYINEIKFLDIGLHCEENKNLNSKKLLNNNKEDIEKNLIKFRNILIKLILKK